MFRFERGGLSLAWDLDFLFKLDSRCFLSALSSGSFSLWALRNAVIVMLRGQCETFENQVGRGLSEHESPKLETLNAAPCTVISLQ